MTPWPMMPWAMMPWPMTPWAMVPWPMMQMPARVGFGSEKQSPGHSLGPPSDAG